MLTILSLTCKLAQLNEDLSLESAKTYKHNAKKVSVGGHADDFAPVMSIGAINENRKNRKIKSLITEIKETEMSIAIAARNLAYDIQKEIVAVEVSMMRPVDPAFDPFEFFVNGPSEEDKAHYTKVSEATATLKTNKETLSALISKYAHHFA